MAANWKASLPKDTDDRKATGDFLREIWTRFKFFYVRVPVGHSVPAGGVTALFVTVPGGGGDIETDLVRGLRQGMPVKLTHTVSGTNPPNAGMTWDCAVMSDDLLTLWWMNSSGAPIAIQDGDWSVFGVLV